MKPKSGREGVVSCAHTCGLSSEDCWGSGDESGKDAGGEESLGPPR